VKRYTHRERQAALELCTTPKHPKSNRHAPLGPAVKGRFPKMRRAASCCWRDGDLSHSDDGDGQSAHHQPQASNHPINRPHRSACETHLQAGHLLDSQKHAARAPRHGLVMLKKRDGGLLEWSATVADDDDDDCVDAAAAALPIQSERLSPACAVGYIEWRDCG
jgi:hypothetical protein